MKILVLNRSTEMKYLETIQTERVEEGYDVTLAGKWSGHFVSGFPTVFVLCVCVRDREVGMPAGHTE